MSDLLNQFLAFGPPGGINSGLAVQWVVIWTVLLGGSLYLSLWYPQWFQLDDEH